MPNARAELTGVAQRTGWQMARSGAYRTLFTREGILLEVHWAIDGRVWDAIYFHPQGGKDQYIFNVERNKRHLLYRVLWLTPAELPEPNTLAELDFDHPPEWVERYKEEM